MGHPTSMGRPPPPSPWVTPHPIYGAAPTHLWATPHPIYGSPPIYGSHPHLWVTPHPPTYGSHPPLVGLTGSGAECGCGHPLVAAQVVEVEAVPIALLLLVVLMDAAPCAPHVWGGTATCGAGNPQCGAGTPIYGAGTPIYGAGAPKCGLEP